MTYLKLIHLSQDRQSTKEHSAVCTNEDHVRKDFLTFTFENTPAIAALASVTQHETEILDYEARALDKLAKDAGANRSALISSSLW